MAFLDNSGDIILDAVLTELGRKRLADGDFQILKFGLGDDEINYGTYDLSHPSGSAYYDLEIMQTPVYEAATAINANINYGLLKSMPDDLLYIPGMELNEKISSFDSVSRISNMFFLAVNSETSDKIGVDNADYKGAVLIAGASSGNKIIIETGLDTPDLAATNANRMAYLYNLGLLDTTMTVSADSKFINQVLFPGVFNSHFKNSQTDGAPDINWGQNVSVNMSSTSVDYRQYNEYSITSIANMIVEPDSGSDDTYSVIEGPKGQVTALNFSVPAELSTLAAGTTSRLYTDYGVTGADGTAVGIGGSAAYKYDYIDTIVFVQGDSSGTSIQIPLRIIRYSSAS